MYGIIEFYKACGQHGISPILGCEILLDPARVPANTRPEQMPMDALPRLVLLAENDLGYANLVHLVSRAHENSEAGAPPRASREMVACYASGLIAIYPGIRSVSGHFLADNNPDAAVAEAVAWREIFGPNHFFLEVGDHGLESEREWNLFAQNLAARDAFRLVATNDVHYTRHEDAEAHDVLLCLRDGERQSDDGRLRMGSDQFHLKSPEEMEETLGTTYAEALAATKEIADRCKVTLELGTNRFPAYPVDPGVDRMQLLRDICTSGLSRRYPDLFGKNPPAAEEAIAQAKQIRERMDYELGVFEKTGFVSYFLIVWDFIRYAKENGIPVGPGRGSAAGSLVAYLLQITDLDPLRYGLLFERFLNPERVSPPDIDVDFCPEGRGRVIDYVRSKYGPNCVAQIVTYGTLGAKAVVKDVARVLGYSYGVGDRLTKLIPKPVGTTLRSALEESSDFQRAYDTEEETRKIVDLAFKLEGLVRQTGIHAAGVVICDRAVSDYVPVARAPSGDMVTQFDMSALTEVGLLKMDFLGLATLTVIEEARRLIRKTRGIDVDLSTIPLDDPKTYDLLNRGLGVGVFQLESPGMRGLCRQFDVRNIDDILALLALYRPGPMDLIPDYIKRKKGEVPIQYEHPLLAESCADTFGVMIYQEQVMKAASVLAGYSLGASDLLRRAMGKKDVEKMAKERENFIKGSAKTHQIPAEQAGKVFDLIQKFAGYGFNKSHSAAYAIIAYQTAYLKANYAPEFMAALLTNETGNTVKLSVFVSECRTLGIPVLPPDINASEARFSVEQGSVRYGLAAVKNVSSAAVEAVVQAREKDGPFRDLSDLCHRAPPSSLNKKTLESLALVGAFDSWDAHRARMLSRIDSALSSASSAHRDAARGQGSLFDMLDEPPATHHEPTPQNVGPDLTQTEKLNAEKELLGYFVSGHPIDGYRKDLAGLHATSVADLSTVEDNSPVRLIGLISGVTTRYTKDKTAFVSAMLEDETGSVELFIPVSEENDLSRRVIAGAVLVITGTLRKRDERISVRVSEAAEPREARLRWTNLIHLLVDFRKTPADKMATLLKRFPGNIPLRFHCPLARGGRVDIEPNSVFFVRASRDMMEQLGQFLGADAITLDVAREQPLPRPKRPAWANRRNNNAQNE
jgi:DNA polymerase-3 subunit alpha